MATESYGLHTQFQYSVERHSFSLMEETRKQLGGITEAVKDLEDNLKNSKVGKELKQQAKRTTRNIDSVSSASERLNDATKQINKHLKPLKSQFRAIKASVRNVDFGDLTDARQFQRAKQEIERYSEELKQLQRQIRGTSAAERELSENLKRQQRTLRNQVEMQEEQRSAMKSAQRVGQMEALRDGGQQVFGVMKAVGGDAIQVYAEFDDQMSSVGAIAKATGDDLERLRRKAMEMGSSTRFTATETAEAMEYLSLSGFSVDETLSAVQDTLNLASAGKLDLGEASDIATDSLSAFGLGVEKLGYLTDTFAVVSTSANTNIQQLGVAMQYAAPNAKIFGATVAETAALIGVMSNAGVKADKAGTATRGAFLRLAAPSAAAKKSLAEFGISLTDSSGNMKNIIEIMTELSDKLGLSEDSLKKLTDASIDSEDGLAKLGDVAQSKQIEVLKNVFGTTGISGGAAVLSQIKETNRLALSAEAGTVQESVLADFLKQKGLVVKENQNLFDALIEDTGSYTKATWKLKGAIKEINDTMGDQVGAAEAMSKRMEDNLAGAFRALSSAIEAVKLTAIEPLVPFIQAVASQFTKLALFLANLPQPVRVAIAVGLLLVTALSALAIVVGTVGVAIFGFSQAMATAKIASLALSASGVPLTGFFQTAMMGFTSLNPLTLFGNALTGISGIFSSVGVAAQAAMGVLITAFTAIGNALLGLVGITATGFLPIIVGIGAVIAIGAALYFAFKHNFLGIRSLAVKLGVWLRQILFAPISFIQSAWQGFTSNFKSILNAVIGPTAKIAQRLISLLNCNPTVVIPQSWEDAITRIVRSFDWLIQPAQFIANLLIDTIGAISGVATKVIDAIANTWSALFGKLAQLGNWALGLGQNLLESFIAPLGAIGQGWQQLVGYISNLPFLDWAIAIGENLLSRFTNPIAQINQDWQKTYQILSNLPFQQWATSTGQNLLTAFAYPVNAIASNWQKVQQYLTKLPFVDWAVSTAQTLLSSFTLLISPITATWRGLFDFVANLPFFDWAISTGKALLSGFTLPLDAITQGWSNLFSNFTSLPFTRWAISIGTNLFQGFTIPIQGIAQSWQAGQAYLAQLPFAEWAATAGQQISNSFTQPLTAIANGWQWMSQVFSGIFQSIWQLAQTVGGAIANFLNPGQLIGAFVSGAISMLENVATAISSSGLAQILGRMGIQTEGLIESVANLKAGASNIPQITPSTPIALDSKPQLPLTPPALTASAPAFKSPTLASTVSPTTETSQSPQLPSIQIPKLALPTIDTQALETQAYRAGDNSSQTLISTFDQNVRSHQWQPGIQDAIAPDVSAAQNTLASLRQTTQAVGQDIIVAFEEFDITQIQQQTTLLGNSLEVAGKQGVGAFVSMTLGAIGFGVAALTSISPILLPIIGIGIGVIAISTNFLGLRTILEGIGGIIRGVVQSLGGVLKILGSLGRSAHAVVTGIIDVFRGLPDALRGDFSTIKNTVTQTWQKIKNENQILKAGFDQVVRGFKTSSQGFLRVGQGIVEGIKQTVSLVSKILNGLPKLAKATAQKFNQAFDLISQLPAKITSVGQQLHTRWQQTVQQVSNFIFKPSLQPFHKLLSGVQGIAQKLSRFWQVTWQKMGNAIAPTILPVVNQFRNIGTRIESVWNGTTTAIKERWQTLTQGLKASIPIGLQNSIKQVSATITNATQTIQSKWHGLTERLSMPLPLPLKFAIEKLSGIVATITREIGNRWQSFLQVITNPVSFGLSNSLQRVQNLTHEITSKIQSYFSALGERLPQTLIAPIDQIKTKISAATDAVIATFRKTIETITSAWKVGTSTIQNLWQSLTQVLTVHLSLPLQASLTKLTTHTRTVVSQIKSIWQTLTQISTALVPLRLMGDIAEMQQKVKVAISTIVEQWQQLIHRLTPSIPLGLQNTLKQVALVVDNVTQTIKEKWHGLTERLSMPLTLPIGIAVEKFSNIATSVTREVEQKWQAFTGFITKPLALGINVSFEKLKATAQEVTAGIQHFFSNLGEHLPSILIAPLDQIKGKVTAIGDGVIAVFRGAVEKIEALWKGLGDKILAPLNQVKEKAKGIGRKLIGALAENSPGPTFMIRQKWKMTSEAISANLTELANKGKAVGQKLESGLSHRAAGGLHKFSGGISQAGILLSNFSPALAGPLFMLGDFVDTGAALAENLPALQARFKAAGGAAGILGKSMGALKGGAKTAITAAVSLGGSLVPIFGSIAAVATTAWTAIIAPALPFIAIGAAVIGAVFLLRKAFQSNFLGIRDLVRNVFAQIRGILQFTLAPIHLFVQVLTGAVDRIRSAWAGFKEWFGGVMGGLPNLAVKAGQGLINALNHSPTVKIPESWAEAATKIKGSISDLINPAQDTAKSMADSMQSAGETAIAGWQNLKFPKQIAPIVDTVVQSPIVTSATNAVGEGIAAINQKLKGLVFDRVTQGFESFKNIYQVGITAITQGFNSAAISAGIFGTISLSSLAPVLLIIGGLGLAVAAIATNFLGLRTILSGVFQVAGGLIKIVISLAKGFWQLAKAARMVISGIWNFDISQIRAGLSKAKAAIATMVKDLGKAIKQIFTGLGNVVRGVFEGIAQIIGNPINRLKASFSSLGQKVKTVLDGPRQAWENFIALLDRIRNKVSGVMKAIGDSTVGRAAQAIGFKTAPAQTQVTQTTPPPQRRGLFGFARNPQATPDLTLDTNQTVTAPVAAIAPTQTNGSETAKIQQIGTVADAASNSLAGFGSALSFVSPALGGALFGFSSLFDSFMAIGSSLPVLKTAIIQFIPALVAQGVTAEATSWAQIWGATKAAIATKMQAITTMGAAGIIQGAYGMIAGAAQWSGLAQIWSSVKTGAAAVVNAVTTAGAASVVVGAYGAIATAATVAWSAVLAPILPVIAAIAAVIAVVALLWWAFKKAFSKIRDLVGNVFGGIRQLGNNLFQGLIETIQSVVSAFKNAFAPIVQTFKSAWRSILDAIAPVLNLFGVQGGNSLIGQAMEGIVNGILLPFRVIGFTLKVVITAIGWIIQAGAWLRNITNKVIVGITKALGILGTIGEAFGIWQKAFRTLFEFVAKGRELISNTFQPLLDIFSGQGSIAVNLGKLLVNIFTLPYKAIALLFKSIGQLLIDIVLGSITLVGKAIINTLLSPFRLIQAIIGGIWSAITSIFSGIKAFFSGMWEAMPGPIKWLVQKLQEGGQAVTQFFGFSQGEAPQQFARGGLVTGAGTSTGDRTLIAASPGEFIVNHAATQQHRGLLEAINSGALPIPTPMPTAPSPVAVPVGYTNRATASEGASQPRELPPIKVDLHIGEINLNGASGKVAAAEFLENMEPMLEIAVRRALRSMTEKMS